jgi:hypothetical protein
MRLARLNSNGIQRFGEYLDLATGEPARLPPSELLSSADHVDIVEPVVSIDRLTFDTRFSMARQLDSVFESGGLRAIERDRGLWTWLTLLHFDSVCPPRRDGSRKLRERAAYIPETDNFQRYYRHLMLGPWLIYRANRDNPSRAMALLCKPPHIIDDVVGQIAARQEYVTNPGIVELATKLYFDPATAALKKGAGGKGGGSPRRLADLLSQLDVTWDLYGMNAEEFLSVLPGEFDRFSHRD